MGEREQSVEEIILDKLSHDKVPDSVANLVISALLGKEELDKTLQEEHTPPPRLRIASAAEKPRPVYLKAITVEGFRGIGPKVTLTIQPGPGLTLVIGRNGSGKSSFAEAAELVLTGDNMRWSGRTVVWKEGWRNLHEPATTAISVDLIEDGQPGTTTIIREWAASATLDDADAFVQVKSASRQPLAAKGWARPLELYRPFLSYSELGALVSGQPSKMYDALQAILGLDQLIDSERRLADARRSADSVSKAAKQELPALLEKLEEHPDERARAAERLLAQRTPDLDALGVLASGSAADTDQLSGKLQQVIAITLLTADAVETAIHRLATARGKVAGLRGTRAADARRLANLLSAALAHHQDHRDQPCPVCGGRLLDDQWAATTKAEIAALSAQAAEADAAHAEEAAATRALAEIVPPKPTVLSANLGAEVDPAEASAAWDRWRPPDVSAETFGELSSAVAALKEQANAALRRRAEEWQPIARELSAWIKQAQKSTDAARKLVDLRKAIDWLRKTGKDVRNARLAPFAETSAHVWEMLRQESNVELGPITLEGSGPQRRVALNVAVDGVEGAALSVMSQGELHALGLALFLPRATASASPFRFIVIDDPVQSMDPAKVDGLARLLSEVARTRQVVVFTHDDRLPAALRQLQLPATVWEVTRRERSVVALKKRDDPIERYLDDARAMAKAEELPAPVRAVAVAGLCRSALEAACVEVVRRRQLAAGVPHADIEEALEKAQKLRQKLCLALVGDADRGGVLVAELRRLGGPGFVNAFRAANSGVHDPYPGDLMQLTRDTERLTKALRQ